MKTNSQNCFMKIVLLVLLVVYGSSSVIRSQNLNPNKFEDWKANFRVSYTPAQQNYRRAIFQSNLRKINAHNADQTQNYKMSINQFTTLTQQQFQLMYLSGLKINKKQSQSSTIVSGKFRPSPTPTVQIDWTLKNGVSTVKNQGSCGSCWSFSIVALVQSFNLIKNSVSLDLSEQQLVDCAVSGEYINYGCNGGYPSNALKYVRDFGITTEALYPYASVNQNCKITGGDFKITSINGASGCTGLQSAILNTPISVGVDASRWGSYGSGVFSKCQTNINHAVLLVGIVSGNWKIKNSWGTTWGQKGYIRLAAGNTCGVCSYTNLWVQ